MNERWLKHVIYFFMIVVLFIGVTYNRETISASENVETSKSIVRVRVIEGSEEDERSNIEPDRVQESKNFPTTGNTGKSIGYKIAGIFIIGLILSYYLVGRRKKRELNKILQIGEGIK